MVSFDVGGVVELVRPGVTGLLAPPEDAEGLGHALTTLLEYRSKRAALGEAARTMVLNEFNEALAVECHVHLYERLLERDRAAL